MAPVEECEHEMFVLIQRKKRQLAVPLMQLEGIQVDEETQHTVPGDIVPAQKRENPRTPYKGPA